MLPSDAIQQKAVLSNSLSNEIVSILFCIKV
jgi:hypothetical protein